MEGFKKQMVGLMADQGLAYGDRNKTYNSRLAQELGSWADTQNNGNELHQQLYRAYFVDNKNISDPEVLVALVEATSLDSDEAREVLAARTFSVRVDEDWSRAHRYGVTGVPTFVARCILYLFFGASLTVDQVQIIVTISCLVSLESYRAGEHNDK